MRKYVYLVPMAIYNHPHSHATDDYVDFITQVFKKAAEQVGIKRIKSDLDPETRLSQLIQEDETWKEAIEKFEFIEDEHWLKEQLRWFEANKFVVDRSNATLILTLTKKRFFGLIGNLFPVEKQIPFRIVQKDIDPDTFEFISQDLLLTQFFWDCFVFNGVKFCLPIFDYIFDQTPDPSDVYYNDFSMNNMVSDMVKNYKTKYAGKLKVG